MKVKIISFCCEGIHKWSSYFCKSYVSGEMNAFFTVEKGWRFWVTVAHDLLTTLIINSFEINGLRLELNQMILTLSVNVFYNLLFDNTIH